jgi:hypothetical protein
MAHYFGSTGWIIKEGEMNRFAEGIHEIAGRHYIVWHEGIVAHIAGPIRNVFDVAEVHRLMSESAQKEIERLARKLEESL